LKRSGRLFSGRAKFFAFGIICLILASSLIITVINYRAIIYAKNNEIVTLEDENQNLTEEKGQLQSWLDANMTEKDQLQSWLDANMTEKGQLQSWLDANMTEKGQLQSWLDANMTEKGQLQSWLDANMTEKDQLQSWLDANITAYSALITELEKQISEREIQIAEAEAQINDFENQIQDLNSQIENLTIHDNFLEGKIAEYTKMFNMEKIQLQTLVFHVCIKDWIQIPDVNAIYNYLVDLFGGQYDVLLVPEYQDGGNWTQTLNWLNASFGGPDGIPIMLQVFEGGNGTSPTPMLSISDVEDALTVANVRYLRIFEAISWHMENNQTFPVEYINQVLEFARNNYLKVFWSEWKNDLPPDIEVFQAIKEYIAGYEDIVIVSFGTNSSDLEPGEGFLQLVDMFEHWGASVQSWYWNTQYSEDPADMPPSLFVQHTLIAIYVGAELIQFEPYWYLFDSEGQPTENLMLLHDMLVW
jgi:cell division protein FtsL